jgi:hypothetical protein
LAAACGTPPSSVITQAKRWAEGDRSSRLAQLMIHAGFNEPLMATPTTHNGKAIHAVDEQVCMLVLEYYAFDVGNEAARSNLRTFGRAGLRAFVASALGLDTDPRRQYFDRLVLNNEPPGYFCVYREMERFMLELIRNGLPCDAHTVPDGSVGSTWGRWWTANGCDRKFGARIEWPHNFPPYFPQAAANPIDISAYPDAALPAFREWMRDVYIPENLPPYLHGKVRDGVIEGHVAKALQEAVRPPELTSGK